MHKHTNKNEQTLQDISEPTPPEEQPYWRAQCESDENKQNIFWNDVITFERLHSIRHSRNAVVFAEENQFISEYDYGSQFHQNIVIANRIWNFIFVYRWT